MVQAVVLTKSTKILEMEISSDKYIETREIESLNQFIRKRLALDDSIITVMLVTSTTLAGIDFFGLTKQLSWSQGELSNIEAKEFSLLPIPS